MPPGSVRTAIRPDRFTAAITLTTVETLDPRPVIGIDLGTTNCALASSRGDAVEIFAILQFVHPGEVREEPLLPSFLFLDESGPIVGVLAQRKGLENPGRLVSSAKSWLSHSGIDRNAAILPIDAPEGVPKVSAVDASRQYLLHLRDAWNTKQPDRPFDTHQVLVTVPASFDAVARDLTQRAAEEAGYRNIILLEEPQAAFYAWIERNPGWRELVAPGDLILVIDIGGGTTDFSLIAVKQQDGEITLERIAVGDHILLGGDNIDSALAHHIARDLPKKLDSIQFHALWQQCRIAKERLLENGIAEKEQPITILGRGTGVVGGSIKTRLKRKDLDAILLDGFLPEVSLDAEPEGRRAGLTELGLPYAADAAITRHLAHFLHRNQASPTHVLFNGGVLRAGIVRKRILDVLNGWLPQPVTPLVSNDLMHAVARGAAYYGFARQGKGVRLSGGVPRTYYIGIEAAVPAVPGMRPPLKALTVVPFGMEEGTGHQIRDRQFALSVGERAQFRIFQSVERKEDTAGLMLDEIPSGVEETAPVEVLLSGEPGEIVPVTLESLVTETGVLELWFVARDGRRWKLEFNIRPQNARPKSEKRAKERA
jgi:molecular chaperone DnaK (HSP70)